MGLLDKFSSFRERRGKEKVLFEKALARERPLARKSAEKVRSKSLRNQAREQAIFEARPATERAKLRLEKGFSFAKGSFDFGLSTGRALGSGARKAGRGLSRVSGSLERGQKRFEKRAEGFGNPLGGSLGESLFNRNR